MSQQNKQEAVKKPNIFVRFGAAVKAKFCAFVAFIKGSDKRVTYSLLYPGVGQFACKQWVKGIIYSLLFTCGIVYFIIGGAESLLGFFTLGTYRKDIWFGIAGEDSIIMLLMGILAWIVLAGMIIIYVSSVKGTIESSRRIEEGLAPLTFRQEVSQLLDKKFYKVVLTLPIIGVCVFNILPIVFMILIAFTNYGGEIVPPELVSWVGFDNFIKIAVLSEFAPTFFKILGWNLLWAVLSTALNFFGGLALALLLNRKCVKGSAIWRAFPILAYAIPGFITLIAFKFMFDYGGPINQMIVAGGSSAIGFFDVDAGWTARILGIMINMWLNIPVSMLLATGILSNMNKDLYEAADIDGASKFQQFSKLTLPFVLFSTTPVLISQFIGNFNNFGIFYFLRSDILTEGYFRANDTDLLINWLYNLSINNNLYSMGAAISLIIFIITSAIALIVYVKSPSYKKEDTFR